MKRIVISGGIFGAILIFVLVNLGKKRMFFFKEEEEFIKSEINGIIINLRDQQHGEFRFTIRQSTTKEMVAYSLSVGKFVKENGIQEQDSISKGANSHVIYFYKKKWKAI